MIYNYFLVVVIIVIILELSRGIKNNNKKDLKAFVHIGPPKTGTTHIQSVLYLYRETLSNLAAVILQKEIKNNLSVDFKEYINSVKFQKHIIVSSEALSQHSNPQQLVNFLHGYNITVISTYREVLSRSLSGCHQHMSMGRLSSSNCIDFVSSSVDSNLQNELGITFQVAGKIGVNKIKVIDYYGLLAAKEEITHVFLCQIIGVLCARTKPQSIKSVELKENASPSPTWVYLITAYTRFIGRKNCERAYALYHDDFELFTKTYKKLARGTNFYDIEKLPYVTKNVSMAVHHSQLIDFQLRNSLLKSAIMYGNSTANIVASENFILMKELDGKKLDSTKNFTSLLQSIYNHIKC